MNWNSNDTKYILKKVIIYLLIAFAMFIISTWKVGAISYNQDVKIVGTYILPAGGAVKTFDIQQQTSSDNTREVKFNKVHTINCNTNKCLVEYNYTTTCYNSNVGVDETGSTYISGASAQLDSASSGYPICTTIGNDIQCVVNNGSVVSGISIYYSTLSILDLSSCKTTLIGSYSVFDISDSVASAVNEVNNSINNDNVTTSDADDFTNNQAFTDSTGLESVIQLPLNMVNSLTNTCQPIQITIPFIDYTGEIPCMSTIYQSKFNTLYTIVKLVINGFFVYRLLLKIYELVHNAKQPDEDKLEVIDL